MKDLKDVINALPAERRSRIDARSEELIADEMTLRDLRKAQDMTQTRMAELLGVGQDNISRLESRADMLVSTLRNYVNAMGGSLDMIVHFPDRPAISLSTLFDHEEETKRPSRRKHSVEASAENFLV